MNLRKTNKLSSVVGLLVSVAFSLTLATAKDAERPNVLFFFTDDQRHDTIHAFMSWQRSVRDGRFKLIEYCVEGERQTQLFDLAEDPQETNNRATDLEHQATVERLRTLLKQERVRLNDGNLPYELTHQQGVDFWTAFEKN